MMFAVSFGLLAFSSFVFDTLDVCTRLGRYVLQEMTGLKGLAGGAVATLITLAAPSVYLWNSPPGSFRTFWIIFGTSNQLLAALTLVGVSVWLWRTGRNVWFALVPAMFMVVTTGTALVLNFRAFLRRTASVPKRLVLTNMTIAAVLFLLGGAGGVRGASGLEDVAAALCPRQVKARSLVMATEELAVRILLVEDNPGDARLVYEMLEEGGEAYSLTHVKTLNDALEHLGGAS